MATRPSEGTIDLSQLSDEELVRLLPTLQSEKYLDIKPDEQKTFDKEPEKFLREDVKRVLDILWWRHYPKCDDPLEKNLQMGRPLEGYEKYLRRRIERLCPYEYSDLQREEFFAEARKDAYLNFLHRFRRNEEEPVVNFDAFVRYTVINAARDLARTITGIRGPGEPEVEEEGPTEPAPRLREIALGEIIERLIPSGTTPEVDLITRQVQLTVLHVLLEHAKKNPLSTKTVILSAIEGQSFPQIAKKLLPSDIFSADSGRGKIQRNRPTKPASQARQVNRLFERDVLRMSKDLTKYGIDSEHVFHALRKSLRDVGVEIEEE